MLGHVLPQKLFKERFEGRVTALGKESMELLDDTTPRAAMGSTFYAATGWVYLQLTVEGKFKWVSQFAHGLRWLVVQEGAAGGCMKTCDVSSLAGGSIWRDRSMAISGGSGSGGEVDWRI